MFHEIQEPVFGFLFPAVPPLYGIVLASVWPKLSQHTRQTRNWTRKNTVWTALTIYENRQKSFSPTAWGGISTIRLSLVNTHTALTMNIVLHSVWLKSSAVTASSKMNIDNEIAELLGFCNYTQFYKSLWILSYDPKTTVRPCINLTCSSTF